MAKIGENDRYWQKWPKRPKLAKMAKIGRNGRKWQWKIMPKIAKIDQNSWIWTKMADIGQNGKFVCVSILAVLLLDMVQVIIFQIYVSFIIHL